MMKASLWSMSLSVVVSTAMCALTPVCTPATTPPQVLIPSFMETSYRAEVSAKILEKKASAYGYEVFDSDARRFAMSYTYHNVDVKQITDLDKKTSYYIAGDVCTLQKFDDINLTNNGQNMMSIKSALAIGGNSIYKGNTTIRGIPVEHWQFCNSQRGGNVTFTNDVYLATTEWLNPSGVSPPFPIRFDVKGKWINPKGSEENFHNLYDFVMFEKYQGNKYSAEFELPPEVQCSNVPHDKTKWPSMSGVVSTSIHTIRQGNVFEGELFYDTNQQLSQEMVYTPKVYMSEKLPSIQVKVRDFNEGVVYSFDSNTGVCDIFPFNHVFDASKDDFLYTDNYQTEDQGFMHMSSVQHMFGMEGTFSYSGLIQVRGIWCDSYYRTVQNYNGQPGPSTIGFFFAANATTYNTLGINGTTYHQLMRRTIVNGFMNEIQDFYNFDAEPQPLTNPFDVTHCFDESGRLPFILTFNAQRLPPKYYSLLAKTVKSKIVQLAEISPIRYHWEGIETVKGVPTLRGTLLDKTQDYKKFAKAPGKVVNPDSLNDYEKKQTPITVSMADYKNVPMAADLCASICAKERDVTIPADLEFKSCLGFDHCDSGKTCTFYISGYSASRKENYLKDSNSCDHFQKLTKIKQQPTLAKVWKSIQDEVDAGNFKIPFAIDGKTVTFTATSITDLRQYLDISGDAGPALRNFIPVKGVEMTKGLHLVANLDLTNCATSCQNSKAFQCAAFTYCPRTLVCLLSSERPLGYQLKGNSKYCNSYIRTYLTYFTKIEGTTALTKDNSVYQTVDSEEDCGKMCLDYTGFPCESFEFCTERGGTCLLGRSHFYDIPISDISDKPMCTHYSRNYLNDFRETNSTVTQVDGLQEATDVTVAQCAKLCVSSGADSCYGFYYKASAGTCNYPVPGSQGSTLVVAEFTLYERVNSPVLSSQPQTDSGGYSSGQMAGAAIGSIALGIATALVALFLFGKFQNRDGDTSKLPMSFTPGMDTVNGAE